MTRILLFLVTNVAVLAVISIVIRLLGLEPYLTESGINYQSLLVFCALFGMGGSFISLLMSKTMAKRGMGVRVIENPASEQENWLISTVRRQASEAGIGMPEVGIFDQPVVNAFATGARRDDALVAVSSGLLTAMSRDEAEAVIGHEVTHVANGDMVTLSLIQGVVNTFVMFLSRVVGFFVDRVLLRNERGYGPGFFITTLIAQLFLGILATMIVMWFSRWREFRADAGGAALSSRDNMIHALEALKRVHDQPLPNQLQAFGISGGVGEGLKKLLMSHPPLDERIAALRHSGAG